MKNLRSKSQELEPSVSWSHAFYPAQIIFCSDFPVSDHTTYQHCLSLLHIENYIKLFDTLFGILPFDSIHTCILQNKMKDASEIVISPWRFYIHKNSTSMHPFTHPKRAQSSHSLTTSLHLFIPSSFLFYLSLIISPDMYLIISLSVITLLWLQSFLTNLQT